MSDSEGTVLQYAVTSCARSFKPTFTFGKGGSAEGKLTLQVSTLSSLDSLGDREAKYYISGATANSYLFDIFSGGNPSQYKTYAWGVNFACRSYSKDTAGAYELPDGFVGEGYEGLVSEASHAIQQLRQVSIINTYVETAPFAEPVYGDQGDLGVDRILIRTVT